MIDVNIRVQNGLDRWNVILKTIKKFDFFKPFQKFRIRGTY